LHGTKLSLFYSANDALFFIDFTERSQEFCNYELGIAMKEALNDKQYNKKDALKLLGDA
jgi:hypothetical protein